MAELLPTGVLRIQNEANWEAEMLAFGKLLEEQGERAWFEVRWPAPVNLSVEQAQAWAIRQEETYDAVEIVKGRVETLPPYAQILAEAK